jgi:3-oxoacyl-[acyl-carrier-protein] synthase II
MTDGSGSERATDGRRALITGLGALSSVGRSATELWSGLDGRRRWPRAVGDPDAHMRCPAMYLIDEQQITPEAQPFGRTTRFAAEAARAAWRDAALPEVDADRLAVVVGSSMGDLDVPENRMPSPRDDGRWQPAFTLAATLSAEFGAGGPSQCTSNACAASAFAVAIGAEMIADDEADVVIAGGADSYSRAAMGSFDRLGATDPERCRPFDRNRAGTVFGEGAAFLVLESAEHARQRVGAHSYAAIAGSGWSCDAHHPTAPEPGGEQILRAMRAAIASADGGEELACIVPHGTGTRLNDAVESQALQALLGRRFGETPLFSLKSVIGHTAGAAGAFACLVAALMLDHGQVPPNIPLDEPDPECPVVLPLQGQALTAGPVLVNTYGFGGSNVSLTLERA